MSSIFLISLNKIDLKKMDENKTDFDLKGAFKEEPLATIFFVVFLFFLPAWSVSDVYIPVRLFYTGQVNYDVVKKITFTDSSKENPIQYYTIESSKYNLTLYTTGGGQIKQNDKIRIFVNPKMNKGLYLGDDNPTLFFILNNYDNKNMLNIFFGIFFILVISVSGVFSLIWLIKKVISQSHQMITDKHTVIERYGIHIKNLLPVFTLLTFSYVICILMIQTVLFVEHQSGIVVGLFLAYTSLFVLFGPMLIWKLSFFIKKSESRSVRNFRVIAGTLVTCYLTYATIKFIATKNFQEYENIKKLCTDFFKLLFPL